MTLSGHKPVIETHENRFSWWEFNSHYIKAPPERTLFYSVVASGVSHDDFEPHRCGMFSIARRYFSPRAISLHRVLYVNQAPRINQRWKPPLTQIPPSCTSATAWSLMETLRLTPFDIFQHRCPFKVFLLLATHEEFELQQAWIDEDAFALSWAFDKLSPEQILEWFDSMKIFEELVDIFLMFKVIAHDATSICSWRYFWINWLTSDARKIPFCTSGSEPPE